MAKHDKTFGILALLAGILILLMPSILYIAVAVYLIIIGILELKS